MERMEPAPAVHTTLQSSTSRRSSVWSSTTSGIHALSPRRHTRLAEIAPSEAKNRQAAVRIADLKAELMQLDFLLADTTARQHARQNELVGGERDEDAPPSADSLPEVLYPPFDFDGEFEGTFGQPRRGIMSELLAMCDMKYWSFREAAFENDDNFSPQTPPDSPQLTQDNGSSVSTLSTPQRSDLGITGLYTFPSPPTRVFEASYHQRDASDASAITVASNTPTMHECATILQATPVLLPRKSPNPAVVHISPPGKREPFDMPTRRSEMQLRRSAGFWNFDPPTETAAHGLKKTADAEDNSSRCEAESSPSKREEERTKSNPITTELIVEVHEPTTPDQHPVNKPARLPSHRASYSWIPARASSLYHDLQKPRPAEPVSEVDQPAIPPIPLNPQDQALSKPRRRWRIRRLNRIPKGRDRLPTLPAFGRAHPRRLTGWLTALPLSPRWRKARNSILTDLGTLHADQVPRGENAGPASSTPIPRNRVSADFRFERTLMAGLESSNLSSSGSMTTRSLRTVRTIRRLSRASTISSKPTSAARSVHKGADPLPCELGKAAVRSLPPKLIRANQHGTLPGST